MTEKEFVSVWISKLQSGRLKNFPDDFITLKNFKEIDIPYRTLTPGNEMFGQFEVISVSGEHVCYTDSYDEAKFIIYSAKNTDRSVRIPNEKEIISKAIKSYENYLDKIIKEIDSDYKNSFPGEKNQSKVISEIFNKLNLVRY